MEENKNIDFNNLSLILNMLKNNEQHIDENSIFKIKSNSNIKTILPFIAKDDENIYKMLNCIEINNVISTYRETNKNVDNTKALQLKKEAILHIKKNVEDKNQYIADIFIKAMEIKEILNNRGVNNGL